MAYDYYKAVKEDAIEYLTNNPISYEDYNEDYLNIVEYLMYEEEVTRYNMDDVEEAKSCIKDNLSLLVEAYIYDSNTSQLIEDLGNYDWTRMDFEIRFYILESVIGSMCESGEIEEYIDFDS